MLKYEENALLLALYCCGNQSLWSLLYLALFSRYNHFCEKFENSKWPPFLARQKCFKNWDGHCADIPCRSKILSKLLYLARFSRYKLCFAIFAKNSKWPPFLERQKFFKNCDGYSAEIPCGPKILSKSLYLARFSIYKHFCVLQFSRKNSKWPPFLARQKFFKNCNGYSSEIPCGPNISSKSLYLARFSIYKHFCVLQFSRKNSK